MRCIKPYLSSIVNKNHDFFIQPNIFYPKKIPDGIRDWNLKDFKYGGETQDRTGDTRIFNPLLYLLSYHADAVY